MRRPATRSSRHGFTLIEMLVYISVSGILLVINAAWIHQSLKFSSAIKQRQQHHQTLLRLAENLRDDARLSESMELKSETELVLQSKNGGEFLYTISSSSVEVEKRRADTVYFRDRYRLTNGSVVRWQAAEMPEWIALVVHRGRESLPKPSPEELPAIIENGPIDMHVRVAPQKWRLK